VNEEVSRVFHPLREGDTGLLLYNLTK